MSQFPFNKLPLPEIIEDISSRLSIDDQKPGNSNYQKGAIAQESTTSISSQPELLVPPNLRDVDVHSLEHLPVIWGAIKEVALNTLAPGRLITSSALGTFATIAQGLYDVRSPLGSVRPLSLNMITVALSGERKTTVDRIFLMVLAIVMEVINEHIQKLNNKADAELEKWGVDDEILIKKYKAAKRTGPAVEEEAALSRHKKMKPQKLDYLMMIHDDFTMSALLLSLHDNMFIASISTSEGAKVLDDASMKTIPILNKAYDGDPVQVSRISRESYWLKNFRLSTSLMIQPDVLKKIIGKRHDELRSSGYVARSILCYPESNIGRRPIVTTRQYTDKIDLLYARLGRLCIELLLSLSDPEFKRKELMLDQEGEQLWLNFANDIESKMNVGGCYQSATDHASKLPENVLRVAGVLHAVEFGDGDITAKTLNAAIQICMQSSKDFVDCFVPPPQDVVNGQKLQKYLYDNYVVYLMDRPAEQMYFDERFIGRNRALQCGPLANAEQMNQALGYLIRQRIVSVVEEVKPKGRGTVYINLIPDAPLPHYSVNGYPLRFSSIN